MHNENQQPLMTVAAVAERLLVARKTVRRWLREGALRGSKVGCRWRVRASAVDELLGE